MKLKLKTALVLSVCFFGIVAIDACKKDVVTADTDTELYNMAKETNGFTFFKKTATLLAKSSGTGHSAQPLLRTRYNAIAAAKLDTNGRIMAGTTFPEGSLIVKELYNNATTLARYAVLYKKPSSADADAKGWVWGYINADGSVVNAAAQKGSGCTGCHSQTDNIDYMLMNKYFP